MWYYVQNGARQGPVNDELVKSLIEEGKISHGTMVWKEGMANWMRADQTDLRGILSTTPVPAAPVPPSAAGEVPGQAGGDEVAEAKTSAGAVWSLILGIAAFVLCLGPVTGIPAIICGHIAQSRIRKSGGALKGDGMAIAGLIMGYLSFLMIAFMGMMAAIAIPSFVKARDTAQVNMCVNNMRMIDSAKEQWAMQENKQDGSEVDTAAVNKFIKGNQTPVCAAGGTYKYNPVGKDPECSKHGSMSNALQGRHNTGRPPPRRVR